MTTIDPIYLEIGARIRCYRKEWLMSVNALSVKTHLPIGRIEQGLEAVSIPALCTIAQALHCRVATLLGEE